MKKIKAFMLSLFLILFCTSAGHAYTYSFDIQSGEGLLNVPKDFSRVSLETSNDIIVDIAADPVPAGTRLSYTASMDLNIGLMGFLNIGFSEQGLSMGIFQGIDLTEFIGNGTDPVNYSGNRLISAQFDPYSLEDATLAYNLMITPDPKIVDRYAIEIATLLLSGGNTSAFVEGLFDGLVQQGSVPLGISTPINDLPLSISGFISVEGTPTQTTPTPVPSALWLMGSGLLGLIGLRRKQ